MTSTGSLSSDQLEQSNLDSVPAVVIMMTKAEARECVEQINAHSDSLGRLLMALYKREGWRALGYESWHACAVAEFESNHTYLYEILGAVRVERNFKMLRVATPALLLKIPLNEHQAAVLAPLQPDQQHVVWQRAKETVGDSRITADLLTRVVKEIYGVTPIATDYAVTPSYKRKSKRNRNDDKHIPQGFDLCQPPSAALEYLIPYLKHEWLIWEPAPAEGLLVDALRDSGYKNVICLGMLTDQNFFDHEPPEWDSLLTIPPFSYECEWMQRCYELGKPFALLLPVEILGTQAVQALMQHYGFEIMLLHRDSSSKISIKDGEAAGSQFPVFWFCWQLLPQQVMFGTFGSAK